jgi:hypothetical protein
MCTPLGTRGRLEATSRASGSACWGEVMHGGKSASHSSDPVHIESVLARRSPLVQAAPRSSPVASETFSSASSTVPESFSRASRTVAVARSRVSSATRTILRRVRGYSSAAARQATMMPSPAPMTSALRSKRLRASHLTLRALP